MPRKWVNKQDIRPDELKPRMAMAVKVVAVIGAPGPEDQAMDWAAYLGPSFWTDDMVADAGDKILPEVAERLFPVCKWANLEYRP